MFTEKEKHSPEEGHSKLENKTEIRSINFFIYHLETFLSRLYYLLILILFLLFFQEHPSLRGTPLGTPLAMLAAQCNKLSNKSPPPLADAAVGKGFHPWKKSPNAALGQHSPTAAIAVSNIGTAATQRNISTSSTSMGNISTR